MPDGQEYLIKTDSGDFRILADAGLPQDQVIALAAKANPEFAKHYQPVMDSLTAQTQAAAQAAAAPTGPAPLPASMQPNTNNQTDPSGKLLPQNIADALTKHMAVQVAQNRAANSPTPVTNASAILAPVTTAKQIVGSKLGSIVGEHAAPYVGASPETGSAVGGLIGGVGASFGNPEGASSEEWQAINKSIGAKPSSIRLPKSATSIEEAATIPARGLQAEGLDASTLNKMTHVEQQAVITPKWNAAGKKIDQLVIDATAQNATSNPSQSALKVVTSIENPKLQEKAVKELSSLMEEVGIRDASNATPLEQLQLRRALRAGARFRDGGDLSSLGGIRAQLYNAVSDDLQAAVPGLKDADQHYSDLNSALNAVNASARKEAISAPRTMKEQLMKYAPWAGTGIGTAGTLYGIWNRYSRR